MSGLYVKFLACIIYIRNRYTILTFSEILFGSDHQIEYKTFQISETGRKFCLKQFSSFNQVLSLKTGFVATRLIRCLGCMSSFWPA